MRKIVTLLLVLVVLVNQSFCFAQSLSDVAVTESEDQSSRSDDDAVNAGASGRVGKRDSAKLATLQQLNWGYCIRIVGRSNDLLLRSGQHCLVEAVRPVCLGTLSLRI